MNLICAGHYTRCYSYEAITILRALHHVRFFFNVNDNTIGIQEVFKQKDAETGLAAPCHLLIAGC